jgi:hypothetical protein
VIFSTCLWICKWICKVDSDTEPLFNFTRCLNTSMPAWMIRAEPFIGHFIGNHACKENTIGKCLACFYVITDHLVSLFAIHEEKGLPLLTPRFACIAERDDRKIPMV